MLIGQTLRLSFARYSAEAVLPVVLGLITTWGLIVWQTRGHWAQHDQSVLEHWIREEREAETPLDRWQTAKGLLVAGVLVVVFLFAPWPKEHVALTAAGLLLMSRKLHSNKMLGLVDWQLLILFMGLFVVNYALQKTGLPAKLVADLTAQGIDLRQLGPLFLMTFLLSNVVSNVPAVMLLIPLVQHPMGGVVLALVSTLAGNLLIVGSIANIIVADAAARRGIRIDWRQHARVGIPVTLVTLAISAGYLWLRLRAMG
jgi:Na+/H+ antiporter NhaD/arsenite permease-like protein